MGVVLLYVVLACLAWAVFAGVVWLRGGGELPAWFLRLSMGALFLGLALIAPVVLRDE